MDYYVIEGTIYTLSEKKEKELNILFPKKMLFYFPKRGFSEDVENLRHERLKWIEKNGKFIDHAIVENY
jgi:hypothetical protein